MSGGAMRTLALDGELTIYRAAELKAQLLQALGAPALRIELAQVAEIDSAGMQLLLLARREAEARGCALAFGEPSEAVRELSVLYGLGDRLGLPVAADAAGA